MAKTFNIGGVAFDAVDGATTGGSLVLTAATADDDSGVFSGATYTDDTRSVAAGNPAQETMKIEVSFGDGTVLNGGTDIEIAYNKSMSGKEIAEQFIKNLKTNDPDGKAQIEVGGAMFDVTNDNGYLTFEMQEDPTNPYAADLTAKLEVKNQADTVVASAGGANSNKNDLGVTINQDEGIGVHMFQSAKSAETRHLAQGSLDLSTVNNGGIIKDGTALKIGNETYVFAIGSDSKCKDLSNVVDLTYLRSDVSDTDLVAAAACGLSAVAKDNTMFDVSTDNKGGVRLTEKLNSGIDYTVNDLQGPNADDLKEQTGKESTVWKDLVQFGTANLDAKPAAASGGLMLQIGDTADDHNQLRVSINDCHTSSLGLDNISIADQESAASAIDAIKAAINYMSDVRGTLGATQNRLDHTINSLSVMTENIQDAESTIRDVDVAEEMMDYTKNDILIQASQAMLAQANQVPQGVLQLLQ